jgi:hypothetical protein
MGYLRNHEWAKRNERVKNIKIKIWFRPNQWTDGPYLESNPTFSGKALTYLIVLLLPKDLGHAFLPPFVR